MNNSSTFPYTSTFMLRNGVIANKPFMTGAEFDTFNAFQHVVWAVLIDAETGKVAAQTHVTVEEEYD